MELLRMDDPINTPDTPGRQERSRTGAMDVPTAHLEAMLDSITDGILSLDRDWRLTYVNRTAERLLRCDWDDLAGRRLWEVYPDLVGSDYYRTYHQAAASGEPRSCTAYYAPLASWFEARAFPHVAGLSVLFRDVTREHDHSTQLEYQAGHDYLTGLPNRRQCMQVLSQAVAFSRAPLPLSGDEAALAVLFVDLDRFKEVNDAFGHATGDTVLREIARRFRELTTPPLFVARVGGDEFVFVLRGNAVRDAERIARSVIERVSEPMQAGGRTVTLGASIGIAVLPSADPAVTAETLLDHADVAMYAAKAAGRLQFRMFRPELARGMREKLALRGDLPSALADHQFVLHYQPQVALADASLVGAEALLRWQHPARGLLSPAEFLDVIFDSPMEAAVGEWVIRAVCRQLGDWLRAGVPVPKISLNLSARQLMAPGLPATVARLAREYGVPAAMLDVEVTEDSLMTDFESAASVLHELKSQGLSTSLDDFGSGYSSLSYLIRLPIDTLKIDRSFVHALGRSPNALAVMRGVIGLARSLGMRSLAEGVEVEAERRVLAQEGCDVAQGFLFSRPLPPADFTAFVLASHDPETFRRD
jgi:diguanylate cyclase (GGDEF)-like protein